MPTDAGPSLATGAWRRRTASGVVLTAIALGVRDGLAVPSDPEAVVAGAPAERRDPDTFLDLYFDARGPAETWAVVRPWLIPPGRS